MVIINLISVVRFSEVIWGTILIAAFLLSLAAHEAAHALVGSIFGFRESNLVLLPSGSVGGGIDRINNFRVKTVVLLAGPLTNLAIAFLLKFFIQPYSAYWNEPANIGVVEPGNFLFQLHLVNLSLGIVNLVPVLPTDGGRVLRGILDMRVGSQRSRAMMAIFSKWVALAGLLLSLYYLNLSIILFAIYILFTWRAEDQLAARNHLNPFSNAADPKDFFLTRSHLS
jgi:stage IV sporulation protein FB